MKTPVLVPWRTDNGRRAVLWESLRNDLWADWNLVPGDHEAGPFNRSAAINDAAAKAGDWDVAVIADADTYISPTTVVHSIELAKTEQRLVIPHSRWVNVDEDEVDDFQWERVLRWKRGRTIYNCTLSSILVVPRPVWDTVNGFDERFVGWGWEDIAFMHAVDVMTGGHIRLEGDVYHLAHDRPQADINRTLDSGFIANSNHYRNLYKRSNTDTQLRRVIAKNRVTL